MPENNLSVKVYKILEEAIVLLALKPGRIYPEKELMEQFQVSRTPLREALLKLSAQSLITIISRRGVKISDINMSNQLAILETRRALDNLLIKKATIYATFQEKRNICKYKKLIDETVKSRDVKEYLRVDKAMDEEIYSMARNPFATNATLPLHTRSRRFWYYFKGLEGHECLEESAKMHIKLLDAIIGADEKSAIEYSNQIIDVLVSVAKRYL